MKMINLSFVLLSILWLGSAQELTDSHNYEVTITVFDRRDIKLSREYHLPLYCTIEPTPGEPIVYKWRDNTIDHDNIPETGPYALYVPPFNHVKFGTAFCRVETQANKRVLGQANITIEIEGYLEPKGETSITFQPPESVLLQAVVQKEYTQNYNSPTVNMVLWTRWTHNGQEINLTGLPNELTLSLENTENSTAGVYQLGVTHFFPAQVDPASNNTFLDPEDMYCSGVILDAMQLYALFSPVQFQVSLPGSTISVPSEVQSYEFVDNRPLALRLQISLQQIRGLDLALLSETNQITSVMLRNGDTLADTTERQYFRQSEIINRFGVNYLINRKSAQVELTFTSPQPSLSGIYEYQFYLATNAIVQHLTQNNCNEMYVNFVPGRVHRSRVLIGMATFIIKMADGIVVNASETHLLTDDKEGYTLSCSFTPQRNESRGRLTWFKNEYVVAASDSSTLYLNTREIRAESLYLYGTYTCKTADLTTGQKYEQSIHLSEKVQFSLQLRPTDNNLDCKEMSPEALNAVLGSELTVLFSQVCGCDITTDHITMGTVSCDESMLTMNMDLVYSNSVGDMTASDLLGPAASRLLGMRTLGGEMLTFDINCPIRDAQGACIEMRTVEVSQFTTLAISLLVILCLLIAGVVVTATVLCALKLNRRKETSSNLSKTNSKHPQTNGHQNQLEQVPALPLPVPPRDTHSDVSTTEPQAYSYPLVHSSAWRVWGRSAPEPVLPTPDNNNMSNTESNMEQQNDSHNSETSPIESSFNCIPNAAYTDATNESQRDSVMTSSYQSIKNNRAEFIPNRDHLYECLTYEDNEEDERQRSWVESSNSYI